MLGPSAHPATRGVHTFPSRCCPAAAGALVAAACLGLALPAHAAAPSGPATSAPAVEGESLEARGWRLLTTKPYLPADFDQETFDQLWQAWEEPLRSRAEAATPPERRRMAFERYGLDELPERPGGIAAQYVDGGGGQWVMNCLACHGGRVAGRFVPGLPNTRYALQTLTDDVRATKLRLGKRLTHMDIGSLTVPLGGSIGTTNAVMFGKILLAYRDAELNFVDEPRPIQLVHHDHDAPPWWHLRKKQRLYIDGFAPNNHRALMQFLLVRQNGPEKFRAWEDDFRAIRAWMLSIEPPKYPYPIDAPLAARGERVFTRACAECHGTYGAEETYPERIVPLAEVGTDLVRHEAISVAGRRDYGESWFAREAEVDTLADPPGYVAPPLDGIWASAPYFHNGAVPTLWHVLHAEARPKVWHRAADEYDAERVGLRVDELARVPREDRLVGPRRRTYFDTSLRGKSAAGHTFPEALSEDDKRALLEYLKTL